MDTSTISFSSLLLLVSVAACDRPEAFAKQLETEHASAVVADSIARARQDSANRAQPGYVVDSLLPVEEEIRRFRATIGGARVTALTFASPSRDSLVARFAKAVERADTTDLQRMAMSSREFIDLYYPESPHTHAPYRQAPGFLWGFTDLSSSKGLTRVLQRRGGQPLRVTGTVCEGAPERQGANRIWAKCEIVVRDSAGEHRERLFGAIIERDGQFKFMSYANQY